MIFHTSTLYLNEKPFHYFKDYLTTNFTQGWSNSFPIKVILKLIFIMDPKFTPKPSFSFQMLNIRKLNKLFKKWVSNIETMIWITHDLKKCNLSCNNNECWNESAFNKSKTHHEMGSPKGPLEDNVPFLPFFVFHA